MAQERRQTQSEKRLAITESAISRVELIRAQAGPIIQAKLGEVFSAGRISTGEFLKRGADRLREEAVIKRINSVTLPKLIKLKSDLQVQIDSQIQSDQLENSSLLVVQEQREEELPLVKIDYRNKEVEIGGKVMRTRSRMAWTAFVVIAKEAPGLVSNYRIAEVTQRQGSKSSDRKRIAGHTVEYIRDFLGDFGNLVVSVQRGQDFFYRIKANVEFSGDMPSMVISEQDNLVIYEGRIVELTPNQAKVLRILARNVGEKVLSKDLAWEVFTSDDAHGVGIHKLVWQIGNKLNEDDKPNIVFSDISGPTSGYILNDVEISWKDNLGIEDIPVVKRLAPRVSRTEDVRGQR